MATFRNIFDDQSTKTVLHVTGTAVDLVGKLKDRVVIMHDPNDSTWSGDPLSTPKAPTSIASVNTTSSQKLVALEVEGETVCSSTIRQTPHAFYVVGVRHVIVPAVKGDAKVMRPCVEVSAHAIVSYHNKPPFDHLSALYPYLNIGDHHGVIQANPDLYPISTHYQYFGLREPSTEALVTVDRLTWINLREVKILLLLDPVTNTTKCPVYILSSPLTLRQDDHDRLIRVSANISAGTYVPRNETPSASPNDQGNQKDERGGGGAPGGGEDHGGHNQDSGGSHHHASSKTQGGSSDQSQSQPLSSGGARQHKAADDSGFAEVDEERVSEQGAAANEDDEEILVAWMDSQGNYTDSWWIKPGHEKQEKANARAPVVSWLGGITA